MPRKSKEEVRADLEAKLAALDVKDTEKKRADLAKAKAKAETITARRDKAQTQLDEINDVITTLEIELGEAAATAESNAGVPA